MGTLAGGISHDFNNVLQAMLTLVQAARLDGTPEGLAGAAEEVEKEVQRGAGLTRQLLLFSRQLPTEHKPVDLAALAQDHGKMLSRLLREDIAISIEADEGEHVVRGDATQLGQVIVNLVVNARDAMPEGGQVSIRVSRRRSMVVLSVMDSGVGMDARTRSRLFEPFFTTKPEGKGTGLGLAVVWGIVKEHGGTVEVDSEEGQGSAFHIILPAAAQGELAVGSETEAGWPRGDGRRVLLVEDDDRLRRAIRKQLGLLGYIVTDVPDGEAAGLLPEEPTFDLLLTDFRLPGASGAELCDGLRSRWPHIKVVLMSGYPLDELELDSCPWPFLRKPFGADVLARTVAAALDE